MHNENISTDDQVREMSRCAADFEYFCGEYVYVTNPKKGLVSLQLYDFQKRYGKSLQDQQFLLVPKFRQGGFTTVTLAHCLWKITFGEDHTQNIVWFSPSDREAVYSCNLLRNMRGALPTWMSRGVERINDHNVHLSNGNRIDFYTPVTGRGRHVSLMVIDESAYVNKMKEAWAALMPCVSDGGRVVALSSAKVLRENESNWFHEVLFDAQVGKNMFAVFDSKWHEHPDYDNEEWTDNMRTQLGDIGWRVEVECEFVIRTKEEIDAGRVKNPSKASEEGQCWRIIDRNIENPVLIEPKRDTTFSGRTQELPPEPPLIPDLEQETIDLNKTPVAKPGDVTFQSPPCEQDHPEFPEELDMNLDEVWSNIGKVMPEAVAPPKTPEVFDYNTVDIDMLKMAGVLNEKGTLPLEPDYREDLLRKITKGLPSQLRIDLGGDSLSINGIPTKINAKAVEMAVLGLSELSGQDRAVEAVGRIVRKKLQRLF